MTKSPTKLNHAHSEPWWHPQHQPNTAMCVCWYDPPDRPPRPSARTPWSGVGKHRQAWACAGRGVDQPRKELPALELRHWVTTISPERRHAAHTPDSSVLQKRKMRVDSVTTIPSAVCKTKWNLICQLSLMNWYFWITAVTTAIFIYPQRYIVSLSSDKCTYCKSLWMNVSGKRPNWYLGSYFGCILPFARIARSQS